MINDNLIKLKEQINETITLDDAVLATLYAFNEQYIVTNISLLHSLYYEISKKYNIDQLNRLVFRISSIYPYSSDLYNSFFRLETSGILPYYVLKESVYNLKKVVIC